MIFNYWGEERDEGVPVVQLSPLQNICPSSIAKDPPPPSLSLSPREVAWPIRDGQVRARPGPSVIKRPSCAVTCGAGASIIRDDPVSAPSEERARTLAGQLRVKPLAEFL